MIKTISFGILVIRAYLEFGAWYLVPLLSLCSMSIKDLPRVHDAMGI
jgi:hypothetical protein